MKTLLFFKQKYICVFLSIILYSIFSVHSQTEWNTTSIYYKDFMEHVRIESDGGIEYIKRKNEFYQTEAFEVYETYSPTTTTRRPTISDPPSQEPTISLAPSTTPTSRPTPVPSSTPSFNPSSLPSNLPTSLPSEVPINAPSSSPSFSPTIMAGYFDYDMSENSNTGPNNWGNIRLPSDNYWKEFSYKGFGTWNGALGKYDMLNNNACQAGNQQSPIDVVPSGALCEETHEVRSLRGGSYEISDDRVQKLILSNKLRVLYPRRECSNTTTCKQIDPPKADFPNNWGGYVDAMHIDIKVPSEHTIDGIRFDAEMQIYHLHEGRRRFPTQSVMIQATNTSAGYNYYFHELLKQYQKKYDDNQAQCVVATSTNQPTPVPTVPINNITDDFITLLQSIQNTSGHDAASNGHQRNLQIKHVKYDQSYQWYTPGTTWDPHHPLLIPTIWFYRYEGSLTEPPCTEIVSWFVASKPMIISLPQLRMLQKILFTNVDPNNDCQVSSVEARYRRDHNIPMNYTWYTEASAVRPIQPSNDRNVSQCTHEDFTHDSWKGPPIN